MSTYTGRYLLSHGATSNDTPLRVDERTLGEFLRDCGMKTVLVGKTHMRPSYRDMERLGIDRTSLTARRLEQCGFDAFERDDGIHPDSPRNADIAYNKYLWAKGYEGTNPWHSWANSGIDPSDGSLRSGWLFKYSQLPARVPEPDSETPYMVRRGIECIKRLGPGPWCMHLSLIKPHWPYIAPDPYHEMYKDADLLNVVRSENERIKPHPFFRELQARKVSRTFEDPVHRDIVVRSYMGLIKQIDDQVGEVLAYLRSTDQLQSTMIVFTSDHGDYLGDHWLGEKDFFHDAAVKVPLIIYDPDVSAASTRGTVCRHLVESIDLLPTFVDYAGGKVPSNIAEGRSLMPLLRGEHPSVWREFVFSEYDYTQLEAQEALRIPTERARLFMTANKAWKFVLVEDLPPFLFDLKSDPDELVNLGSDLGYKSVCLEMKDVLFEWSRRLRQRVTETHEELLARSRTQVQRGVYVGYWDEDEVTAERRRLGLI